MPLSIVYKEKEIELLVVVYYNKWCLRLAEL